MTPQPGATPYDYDLRVNHPLQVGGVSVFLVGHGYAPVITVRDGDGDVAFSGPVIFLPQDGSFTSFGVVKAPDARPAQLGLEGYLFPTATLGPGMTPYSAFPGPRQPRAVAGRRTAATSAWTTGCRSRSTRWTRTTSSRSGPDTGRPMPLLLRKGQTVEAAERRPAR